MITATFGILLRVTASYRRRLREAEPDIAEHDHHEGRRVEEDEEPGIEQPVRGGQAAEGHAEGAPPIAMARNDKAIVTRRQGRPDLVQELLPRTSHLAGDEGEDLERPGQELARGDERRPPARARRGEEQQRKFGTEADRDGMAFGLIRGTCATQ